MDDESVPPGGDVGAADEAEPSLSDDLLLDLLDARVEERGRVPAARVLGVNYRTLASCCDTRQVSRRMRQALADFRERGSDGNGETVTSYSERPPDGDGAALRERVAELEDENTELRELADEQAIRLEELNRRVAELEDSKQAEGATEIVGTAEIVDADSDGVNPHEQGDKVGQGWIPPRRRPGMPDAGVITLEEQPDEEFAFGPAAALVAEWRQLRVGGGKVSNSVGRAEAAVRRWELEAELLGDYRLTLPPDTYTLDDARRADHIRWRRDALAEARRKLRLAKRARLLRQVITLGTWRK